VNDILAAVVAHGEILLFFYVLADQLGVGPGSAVLMAAGGFGRRLSLAGMVRPQRPSHTRADLAGMPPVECSRRRC
jgi:hypothetical protein